MEKVLLTYLSRYTYKQTDNYHKKVELYIKFLVNTNVPKAVFVD